VKIDVPAVFVLLIDFGLAFAVTQKTEQDFVTNTLV